MKKLLVVFFALIFALTACETGTKTDNKQAPEITLSSRKQRSPKERFRNLSAGLTTNTIL